MKVKLIIFLFLFVASHWLFTKNVFAVTVPCVINCPTLSSGTQAGDWPMVGANLERTSWNTEEIRGNLGDVDWYQPIEPYISYKVQPIITNDTAYISTSKGLYAFDLRNNIAPDPVKGRVKWVFPTELPLGNSPTIYNNVAYVSGYDHKIYALNVTNGQKLWEYEASGGFDTNPLIINDRLYAGNRDGYMYALDVTDPTNSSKSRLLWKFKTDGPINFSAAYKNGVLYFASNDMHAYAVNTSGQQVWKSTQLPGAGFYSFWPVIYSDNKTTGNTGKDYVIFSGSANYRYINGETAPTLDCKTIFPNVCFNYSNPLQNAIFIGSQSTAPNDGYWTAGTVLFDANKIINYFEDYPYRRIQYVLNAQTGQEYTFDSNGNGTLEYAPFTFSSVAKTGQKYPPIVNAIDGIYYSNTIYQVLAPEPDGRSDIVGWKFGTNFISRVADTVPAHAIDEPMAFSSGGKLIYWSLCCDREAGAFDVTLPYRDEQYPLRGWSYYSYDLLSRAPDYQMMYNDGDPKDYNDWIGYDQTYSGKNQSKNGIYMRHGTTQSPPIPYKDKIYLLRGNALIVMFYNQGQPAPKTKLPLATIIPVQKPMTAPPASELQKNLTAEVQKMLVAGHLRPGYKLTIPDDSFLYRTGEIADYFSNPSDTVVTLLAALPYLSSSTQDQVKAYIQNNYGPKAPYDLTSIVHVGWNTGAKREVNDIPQDNWAKYHANFGKLTTSICQANMATATCCNNCFYWKKMSPFNFYAAWKYAQVFGNAKAIFDSMSSKIEAPPTDLSEFIKLPYFLNIYLAGYQGYLELEKLAGYSPENSNVRSWYNAVLDARINSYTKDTPYWPLWDYVNNNCFGINTSYRFLAIARNFMFLTPEVAESLRSILPSIQTSLDEYQYVAPYWFVSDFDNATRERSISELYDSPSLFQAKAYILKEPYEELVKYLDVPAFAVGDLFYIQNLVAALSASNSKPGDLNNDGQVDIADVKLALSDFGTKYSIFDLSIVISNFGK